ncbi:HlyD family efflux transporter periplasmic adaptor subunit [Halopseudomonas sabulinigri]|uniref:Peptidase M50 domain-containing protein n=1 Tax=Halopseudomonas sabulinigri TaxID=472181 RepID=A0ABP9ZT55_9GAMM
MIDPADLPTPPLRNDLRLSEAAPGSSGEPTWVIQDTVVNRFYRIGWLEFECLLRWEQTPRQICQQVSEQTSLRPDPAQILGLRQFLEQHQLVLPDSAAVSRLQSKSEGNQWLTWRWWLHHYLFFRVPLVRPQRPLQRLAGSLDWLFQPLTGWLVLALSLLGILLVLHQWDTFTSAVVDSFSAAGLVSFALALIVAKTLHEMGHALVATRLGLRVAHVGIAFVVLWPMLYTDTGESWKLRSARQRLAIAAAGITTELALAGLATLGWALCEPGTLRNALLYLATTSWILSLALNASPFMRFDGYFILSDLLDFPNLHERSSAQARTFLRRRLLGLQEDWPETFPLRQRRLLIIFAFMTWLYRLLLFLGIAIAVYLLFFKALGIFLFIVEIAWFVVMPVWRELKYWWGARNQVPAKHKLMIWGALFGVLLLLALPWHTQVHGDGVARAERQLRVFSPYPAVLRDIHPRGSVAEGDALVTLDEPDIIARMRSNEASIRSYQARLTGLMADPSGLALQSATQQRLQVQQEEIIAARSEVARLTLKAPFAGQWQDVNPEWQEGQWIGSREPLGILIDPSSWQVDAYVAQDEAHRLRSGAKVRFYSRGQPRPLHGKVIAVASARASQLAHPMLASRFGGPLSTTEGSRELAPSSSLFHVLIQLEQAPPTGQESLGDVQIEGTRRSLLAEGLTYMAAVFLRESGF